MDKNLLQKAKAPMIALIQTKNIMNNNLKTKTRRAAALLLMLLMLAPLAAWAQHRDCNGPIAITADSSYIEDFESPGGVPYNWAVGPVPDCWGQYTTGPVLPHITNEEGALEGAQYLSFYLQGVSYAILPEFSTDINLLKISFWEKFGNGLQLGYITAADNGTCNTFTAIETYSGGGSVWTQHVTYLSEVPETAHRLAFKWIGGGRRCLIDYVEVTFFDGCYNVGTLSTSDLTAHSVHLSWDLVDDIQTEWNVQVANNADFTENLVEYLADSHEDYLIDNLDGGTVYYVRVGPTCSEYLWSNTVVFATQCDDPVTVTADAPYTQDFEDGVIPGCWDVYALEGNEVPYVRYHYSHSHSGSYSLRFTGIGYAVLPEFSNPFDELQISFWIRRDGQLQLGYITAEDDGTCNTFTAIADYTATIDWVQYTNYLLNVPTTAHRLAFKSICDSAVSVYIDYVEVSVIPLGFCYPVGNLGLGRVASNSAYLSWELMDNNQTAWDVQVATDADFTENVANLVADSHENYLVEGLDPDTYYYVRVKPSCSDDLWSNTVQFWTMPPCNGPITVTADAPYTEGFENPEGTNYNVLGRLPACWESYTTGSVGPHNTTAGSANVHSGAQSLSFYNGGDAYAVLPEFSNSISGLQISFWMRTDGNGSGQLRLGYLTAEDDGTCNTFTEIADYGSNFGSMVQRSTTLENVPATAHRLAFKWDATSSYHCFIDDVEVSLNLALKPTDLACTEVTNTSATLTWTSNAESWQIMLNDDETNLIMADTNPFTLTGLVLETLYTAKVRSYWDSDNQSEWSDPVSFSTNGICPEGMVCIGNGTQTNNNLPTSNYYKYGLTQQIYTADEIGQAGCITSIEFFKASAYTMTRNLDIYLVCTDKDEFENTSDWIPVTANDLVFSGTVTFADQDWTTITLDEPFNYYGTSNVAVVVDDNTGGFSYSLPFYVFSTEKEQTILYCDSNNNYDPTASPGNAINTISEKNRIRLGMEELPGCERPTLLAVDTLGATSATLSWTENGEATAWQIMLNDDHTNLIEADSNPFTLDSLIPETTYTAKVRAHCPDGNGISLWSSPISFNPTRAFTIGAGTATNNDLPTNNFYKYSYTQQIYTTEELGEAGLIERIDFFKNSTAACNRNLDIYLVSTDKSSFDGGNDWIVTTEEDLVFSGTVNFVDKAWTIITFDKPFIYNGLHNVAIIVDDHTGGFVSRTPFLVFDAPNQALSSYHDKGEKAVLGQKNQIRVLKSAMGDCINPTMLTASELNYYDATLTWEENGTSTEWVVDYWYLNSSNEEVHNQLTVADSTICLIENLSDNTEYHAKVRPACDENKWSNTAVFTTLEACSVPVITLGTVTATTAELSWNGLSEGYTVMYRESIVRVAGEWQTLSVDEAAVTLNNLVPEADYEVKVIPSCDETKESPILTFTTANPCEAPTNLAVGNITTTTAEISWDGISLSGYEVEYYTATLIDTLLSEGFESGELPQGWIIEGDSQDPTKTWRVGAGDDQASTGTHSGDYNALITHNNRDEVTYLVMPAIDLGDHDNAQLSFWYVNRNWASDIDEIGVFYRIGTEGEWNELWSTADAHATWTHQTLALTGLADNYQIGFRMIDHWGRGIGLDDIVVFHELAPAGEPMTLTVVEGTTATLTGLADNTTYEARVKANCYEAEYSQPVGFTTEPCEDKCTLTFVVTDSRGYGWNGNAIQVKDALTGDIIATIANENLDGIIGSEETQTIVLNVCDGQELEFSWVGSYYNHNVSYTVTDLNEVIVEGSGSGFATFNYTVNCTVTDCRRPTAFAASEIGPRSVVLSWTENGPATEWEIAYKSENDTVINYVTATTNPYTLTGLAPETQYAAQVTPVCEVDKPSIEISWTTTEACPKPYDVDITPYPSTANVEWSGWGETYDIQWAEPVAPTSSAWLRYDNGSASQLTNATSSTNHFTWGVMYPADSLHDNVLTKIVFFEFRGAFTDSIITLNVYSGGDTIPETLIGTETITKNGTQGGHEVVLSTPIEFNPEQNLWITLTATGHPIVMAMSPQDAGINGRWFLNGSDWVDIATLFSATSSGPFNVATSCFAIRGFVETYDYSTWNWTTESGVASPFTITGLEAETDYAVRVKSNCGQDCESGWTWAYFTTLSACDTPIGLEATNITSNSATLNWTGYQDSYNLKYRHRVVDPNTTATIILEAHNVWGNGTGYQMLLDADATAFGTIIPAYSHLTYSCTIPEGLYDAFEYMIPANADASCDPEYFVLDTIISIEIPAGTYDWCITHPIPGEGINIAGYNGDINGRYDNYVFEPGVTYHFTMGYWPLYNQDYVTLEIIQDWSDWTVVENITHPYSFTVLIPEAEYEWQVQGINADCEGGLTAWSEIATFTTLEGSIFTKEIVCYGESNDGYYLIASPVVEPIMPSEENGFLTNAFDLYRFNQNGAQALEWENWKAEENYHFPIENGRGYLYASQENTTLTFVGTPYSGNGQVTLTKTDGVTFEGWNLVGNPFPTMAFIADGRPFYTVNGDGSQIIGVVSHSIEVMEAIFVVAEEDGETMTFTTEMPALGASLSLNVMAAEPTDTPTHRAPTVVDRAIIRFDEGRQLPKFQLNGNSTKVYIPQGSMDYAVVCSESKGELPLNFKAAKNGTYTLTVNVENMDLDYLHLIDNLTGADVDLLAVEPVETPTGGNGPSTSSGTLASYTFTAKTTDYESRFKLVFSANEDVCEPNEAFAYINNGNIVITTDMGDATLQIVDVMGRVVASYGGHTRCVPTSGMPAGVYVLRLIDGENVRTQKIVVE